MTRRLVQISVLVFFSVGLWILTGCKSGSDVSDLEQSVKSAYLSLLSGDLSLFDAAQLEKWDLSDWSENLLADGELEYTYLDLDRDGVEELLIQWVNQPSVYHAVFHYEHGKLFCWNHDALEMTCWDYPLQDGTMVRQYEYGDSCSYTLFRYQSNGERTEISHLFVREEPCDNEAQNACPYYELDGNEVSEATFKHTLEEFVMSRQLDRSVWKRI